MTNEEAKREAILSRWIECGYSSEISNQIDVDGWKKVKFRELPSNKNGLFETTEDLRDGGLPTFYFRPQSIRPIEKNNGWTRIEPDRSNLPDKHGEYKFTDIEGNELVCYWTPGETSVSKLYSHYRKIEREPMPIY